MPGCSGRQIFFGEVVGRTVRGYMELLSGDSPPVNYISVPKDLRECNSVLFGEMICVYKLGLPVLYTMAHMSSHLDKDIQDLGPIFNVLPASCLQHQWLLFARLLFPSQAAYPRGSKGHRGRNLGGSTAQDPEDPRTKAWCILCRFLCSIYHTWMIGRLSKSA